METRLDVSRQRFVRETAARFFLRFHMSLIFAGAAAGGVLGGVAGAGDPARGGLRGLACRGPRQGGAARADRRLGARRVALDGAALRAHARRLGRPRLGGPARVPGGDATAGSADPLSVGACRRKGWASRPTPVNVRAMTKTFRAYSLDQHLLLPPDLREWLPEDDLAWFLSDTVGQLDLSDIVQSYEAGDGRGQPPYHPAMMVKLLLQRSPRTPPPSAGRLPSRPWTPSAPGPSRRPCSCPSSCS